MSDTKIDNRITALYCRLSLADQLVDATRIKELSSELLNRLVDKIEVSEKECADGETTQKVRIYYKFVGALI